MSKPNENDATKLDWIARDGDGRVQRRTIVQGAAWTIPVVAVAAATPAAAASNQPTLAFTQPSYSGTGCGVISGVQVKRTTDGQTPASGELISVTLSDGYTFSDGSTTFSATSGADGTITLPDIEVPAGGGDSAFSATSGTLATTAPVSSTAAPAKSLLYNVSTGVTTSDAVNARGLELVSVGTNDASNRAVLSSDGQLLIPGQNTLVASDVISYSPYAGSDGAPYITYVTSDGKVHNYTVSSGASTTDTVSGTFVSVEGNTGSHRAALTDTGALYIPGTGTKVADDVISYAPYTNGGTSYITYVTSNGTVHFYNVSTGVTTNDNLPGLTFVSVEADESSSRAALTNNGALYIPGTGTKVADNVTSYQPYAANGVAYVTYTTTSGDVFLYNTSTGTTTSDPVNSLSETFVSVDADRSSSRAALTDSGKLYIPGQGTLVAENVISYSPFSNDGTSSAAYISYIARAC
ncbi:hypothetical protein [Rathayibacter sp. VKM Ac-2754]|uniref:hypothetical protein n=1 Tax=Rathayibacter sp. VKM Ac-2754 TaxID=2609251 RepID=UPI00135C7A2A|nr:hypothetical protein [Rathayibacter sp. VKM Ac-2754]MWV59406.1 hypothetical protein [Rathayibacter sp. VKM Ac-2754]